MTSARAWSASDADRHAAPLAGGLVGVPVLESKVDGELVASLPPETQSATWAAISLLLGSITVKVFGHMPPCDETTAEALFRDKVRIARCLIGLPAPRS